MAHLLGADRLADDLAVAHLEHVRVHQARDQGLTEAEAGLHGGDPPVARDGVGREQDAGHLREDHLLHDHGHVDRTVVEAVPQAVGHGPIGEQRGPAAADVLEDRGRAHDVQVSVVLAGEGGRRQILCRRAGSDGVGSLLAELSERAGDRRREIIRDGDPFDGPADLRAERADRLPIIRVQARQLIEPTVDRRRFRHDPPEGVRRHAKASRHSGCRRSATALPDARPCRQRPRPASRRSHADPTRTARSSRYLQGSRAPFPVFLVRPTILQHDPGLAASPPVRYNIRSWRGVRSPCLCLCRPPHSD